MTRHVCRRAVSLFGFAVWSFAAHGGPAVAEILVSNLDQTTDGTQVIRRHTSTAQGFVTGGNAAGYSLTSVEMEVAAEDLDYAKLVVKICSDDRCLDSTIAALTNPSTAGAGTRVFAAPAGTELNASTRYYVHATCSVTDFSRCARLSRTVAAGEDGGGASGWSIDDRRGGNNPGRLPLKFRINGETLVGGDEVREEDGDEDTGGGDETGDEDEDGDDDDGEDGTGGDGDEDGIGGDEDGTGGDEDGTGGDGDEDGEEDSIGGGGGGGGGNSGGGGGSAPEPEPPPSARAADGSLRGRLPMRGRAVPGTNRRGGRVHGQEFRYRRPTLLGFLRRRGRGSIRRDDPPRLVFTRLL